MTVITVSMTTVKIKYFLFPLIKYLLPMRYTQAALCQNRHAVWWG